MLLDGQVRVPLKEEHVVEHVVRAGNRLIDIAELQRDGFVDVAEVAVVMNARLRIRQAVRGRRECSQRLVLDVDQPHGAFGGRLVARHDGRHGIADEPDLVLAERMFVVADRQDAVRNRK